MIEVKKIGKALMLGLATLVSVECEAYIQSENIGNNGYVEAPYPSRVRRIGVYGTIVSVMTWNTFDGVGSTANNAVIGFDIATSDAQWDVDIESMSATKPINIVATSRPHRVGVSASKYGVITAAGVEDKLVNGIISSIPGGRTLPREGLIDQIRDTAALSPFGGHGPQLLKPSDVDVPNGLRKVDVVCNALIEDRRGQGAEANDGKYVGGGTIVGEPQCGIYESINRVTDPGVITVNYFVADAIGVILHVCEDASCEL